MNYGLAPMPMAGAYGPAAMNGRAPAMAMMPAQPVVGGALPCQLCQQYHPPNETCFQHASHHRHSQSQHHHRRRSKSRARHLSDSDSDHASRRSRRKSGHGHGGHRKHRRSGSRRRKARKSSSSDSTVSSVLSEESSNESDFAPSAIQLLEMGDRMAEDVGISRPAPPIVPVDIPLPVIVESPAPRDLYQDIRRAYSRGGVLGQQPAEREGRAVRSIDPTQAERDALRESRRIRSQLLGSPLMHPPGAGESHFSSTPYLPVKGPPSLPPQARLSAAHPASASPAPSVLDNDPLMSPDDLLPAPSAVPSMHRDQHGRPSPRRAPSSVYHQALMEEDQIQAAMQHRSVSEAAFPHSGRRPGTISVTRPPPAAAPPSAFIVRPL